MGTFKELRQLQGKNVKYKGKLFKPVRCLQGCSSGAFIYLLHSYCNVVVIITNIVLLTNTHAYIDWMVKHISN